MDITELAKMAVEAKNVNQPIDAASIIAKAYSDSAVGLVKSDVLQSLSAYQDGFKSIIDRANEVSNLSSISKNLMDTFNGMGNINIGSDWLVKSDIAVSRQNELENKLAKITTELREKSKELEVLSNGDKEKESKIIELTEKINEFEKNKLLNHLLPRVNDAAQKKLYEDSAFADRFRLNTLCKSVVVSIDIRDSTQLMLNAKTPELFARFITSLSLKLSEIVTSNYGVYDKFTGDGLLCFFPDFFSGKDALYFALKTAAEAHQLFQIEYSKSYRNFSVVRADVGLGIGIDFGDTCLTSISSDLTVVGIPVVYACRLSSAPANHTYLNQSAFEVVEDKYSPYYKKSIQSVNFKNQGSMITYDIDLNFDAIKPENPDWI
jgi:class 3 adenylate cyclase